MSKQRLYFREHTHEDPLGGGTVKSTKGSFTIGLTRANGVDYSITFGGYAGDGLLSWMEDEDYFQLWDDVFLPTTERMYFRDTSLGIYSAADGYLDLFADTDVRINTYPVRPVPIDGLYTNFGTAPATDLGYGTWNEETSVGMTLYDLSVTNAAGFFGTSPVAQPDAVADATGAGDVVARLNELLARMRELGLIAT
jgi:hypothetical protein